jgi:hypothetical protein
MAFGPFSSESSAKQTTVTLSDSGQYNQKSDVAQGGSLLIGRKGSLVLPGGLQNVRVDKGATLQIGATDDTLAGLVDNITQATSSQIAAATAANADTVGQLKDLASQRTDADAGNPRTLAWIAVAAIAAFVFIFRKGRL